MMHASIFGQVEVVDTLLRHGAKVDLKDNVRNYVHTLSHFMEIHGA